MQKWIYKNKNKKGFTLIELVVVIAILGILAALAIPRLGGTRITAKKGTIEANLRTIDSSIMIYQASEGKYPTAITDLVDEYLAADPSDDDITYEVDPDTGRGIVSIAIDTFGTGKPKAEISAVSLSDLQSDVDWIAIK